MKNFFLLLALANIAFLIWAVSNQQSTTRVAAQAPLYKGGTLENLQIIPLEENKEKVQVSNPTLLKNAEVDGTDGAKDGEVEKTDAGVCFELANINDAAAANKIKQSLDGLARDIKVIKISEPIVDSYWVVLPAASTWEQSNTNYVNLKSKNLGDIWLVPNGENKGIISFGVFSDKGLAENRLRALSKKQSGVKIINRNSSDESTLEYRLKLGHVFNKKIKSDYLRLRAAKPNMSIRKISC